MSRRTPGTLFSKFAKSRLLPLMHTPSYSRTPHILAWSGELLKRGEAKFYLSYLSHFVSCIPFAWSMLHVVLVCCWTVDRLMLYIVNTPQECQEYKLCYSTQLRQSVTTSLEYCRPHYEKPYILYYTHDAKSPTSC